MKLTRKSTIAPTADSPKLGINRRQFMKQMGVTTGSIAAASMLGAGMMRRAEAKDVPHNAPIEIKRTVCSACAVGCGLSAVVFGGAGLGLCTTFGRTFAVA